MLNAPSVELKIFVTRPDIAGVVDRLAHTAYSADIDSEKLYRGIDKEALPSVSAMSTSLHRGRPNLVNILRDGLRDAQKEEKVLVAVSGPSGLLSDVSIATSACSTPGSARIHLHAEKFHW